MINNSPLSIHRIRKGKKQQQKLCLWIFSSISTNPKGPIQLVYFRVHLESSLFVLWIWRDVYVHPISGGFHSSSFAWTGAPLSSFLHLPGQNSLILSYSLWNTIQTFYATFSRKLPLPTLVEFPILIYSTTMHIQSTCNSLNVSFSYPVHPDSMCFQSEMSSLFTNGKTYLRHHLA